MNLVEAARGPALQFAEETVIDLISIAEETLLTENKLSALEVIDKCYINLEDENKLPGWTELAPEHIIFMVVKGIQEPGTFSLISRDSKKYPILDCETQLWIHGNRFMAGYASVALAVTSANKMY